jgi:transcriptional regulator with XRE-family HTH domain
MEKSVWGETFKHLRMSQNISQKDMAKRLGVTRGMLNSFENGIKGFKLERMEQYAEELGFSIELVLRLKLKS